MTAQKQYMVSGTHHLLSGLLIKLRGSRATGLEGDKFLKNTGGISPSVYPSVQDLCPRVRDLDNGSWDLYHTASFLGCVGGAGCMNKGADIPTDSEMPL